MTFTEKEKLAEACNKWLTENNISSTPFNVITFLDYKGIIRGNALEDADTDDVMPDDPLNRKIKNWVHKNPGNVSQIISTIMVVMTPLIFGVLVAAMIISIINTGGKLS